MRKREDFVQQFRDTVGEQMSDEHAHYLATLFRELLDEYVSEVSEELEKKYREWEAVMDSDDTTLYTLGLRHARDLLLEQNLDERSATLATQYKKELEETNESKTS